LEFVNKMTIGTRGSDLATTQTGIIAEMIRHGLGIDVAIEIIKTKGDIITDRPLREIEGRGYFTRELEEALLDKRIDLAVHSFKDMPSLVPDGLVVACVSEREDPADILIINLDSYSYADKEIPVKQGAVVGTSAVRRETQLRAKRGDLLFKDLRGNVPTRLQKLKERDYDAIFLASAGVIRLNLDLSGFKAIRLDPTDFIPAPGQGVLAVQMRADDPQIENVKNLINNQDSFVATTIERDLLARFGGGCSLPLGAYAYKEDNVWHACGFWGGNQNRPKWAQVSGADYRELGRKLYAELNSD
jgi:hydroxymethylbilane synthase